uniref:Uncharacterized protein n=1 Tax=Anopheles minimus TaxID=112268 RepID=A0A182VZZ8_9DIPT
MAPSPELGQPKAPDKPGTQHEEQHVGPSTSGEVTDRTCTATAPTGSVSSETDVNNSSNAAGTTTNSSINSVNMKAGTSAAASIGVPPVISTMAMSAATTTTTTTPATAVKVSSSSTSSALTPTSATATASTSHGKGAESSKNSSSSSTAGNNKDSHQQSFAQEPLATMNEDALKALLDEAITYKCPKDREHKSATFNELLSKTEREDQEQNFSFTSRPVHSKRASARPTQGGSLQDITEATKQEYGYTEYCSGSSLSHKRHGGGGHGGSRSKRQISSVSSRQREGGSLPSNVNETTTPSYISEQPFLNEVRRPLKSTSAKLTVKSNDYGALLQSAPLNAIGASDWGGIGGLAGEESQSNAAGGETGIESTSIGFMPGGGVVVTGPGAAAHTVINMGELDSDEGPSGHRGFREIFSGHANNALQQNNHYESSADEIEMMGMGASNSTSATGGISCTAASGGSSGGIGGATVSTGTTITYGGSGVDTYGNGGTSSNSSTSSSSSSSSGANLVGSAPGTGGGLSSAKKTFCYPKTQYTTQACLEIGQATNRPSSVHHVDKTVSLPMLEAVQLGSTYPAVKCMIDSSKVDQSTIKSVLSSSNQFISTTRSSLTYPTIQQKFDENGNSVSQFGGSGSGGGLGTSGSGNQMGAGGGGTGSGSGSKKPRKPKSDRNTVVVVPENIAGYRGKSDIEALVSYIENTDNDKSHQPQHQLSQQQQLQLQQQQQQQSSQHSSSKGGSVGNNAPVGGGGAGGINSKNTNAKQMGSGIASNSLTSGGLGTTIDNGGEEKSKRKNDKKRDRAAKMKKSNSLEELSSCSRKKVEEENTRQNHVEKARAQETDPAVTLRNSKSKKSAQSGAANAGSSSGGTSAASASNLAGTKDVGGGKRSERRSWGTEELSFFGNDATASPIQVGGGDDGTSSAPSGAVGGKGKKAKDHNVTTGVMNSNAGSKNSSTAVTVSDVCAAINHNTKKRDSLRMSVESLSALGGGSVGASGESSDFLVVTKKKKTKKKAQTLGSEDASNNNNAGSSLINRRYQGAGSIAGGNYGRNASNSGNNGSVTGVGSGGNGGRYQPSSHFAADREVYMNNDVSRRKSTSSVPPSEKSDSSDADSVHSLPIETNACRKQQQKQQNQQSKGKSNQQQQQQQQTSQQRQGSGLAASSQSYAAIARIANVEKAGSSAGANGSGLTAGVGDGSGNHAEGTSNASANVNMIQDLNSSEAFPQLVESQQFHPHHHSQSASSQLSAAASSSSSAQQQAQLQTLSHASCNNSGGIVHSSAANTNSAGSNSSISNNSHTPGGSTTTRATYSQSLLTAVNNSNDEGTTKQQYASTNATSAIGAGTNGSGTTSSGNEMVIGGSTAATNSAGHPSKSVPDSTKASLHKSKSVDNNDIYYSNEHYPALEKTVKSYHHARANNSADPSVVGSSAPNVTNVANSKNTSKTSSTVAPGSNATSSLNTLSFGQVAASTVPGTQSSMANAVVTANPTGTKKGKAKKDLSGNVVTAVTTVAPVQQPMAEAESTNCTESWNHASAVVIDTDTQTSTMLPFDTRSPMNGGPVVNTIHFIQTSPQPQQQPGLGGSSSESPNVATITTTGKRQKKDKHQHHSASSGAEKKTGGNTATGTATNPNSNQATRNKNRPAVIIVNDNEPKSNEFTFGFDIDQELLFGDFSEEDRKLLEGGDDSCPEPPKSSKGKQQRRNSAATVVDPVQQQSVAPSNSSTAAVQTTDLDYAASLSPTATQNDTRNSSISKASPSSGSSSVSSSSASLSSATTCNSYQQQQQPSVPVVQMAIVDQPSDATETPIDVTGTNIFHQPPPVASTLLLRTIYTQPPPTLPTQHLTPAQSAPSARPQSVRHHPQQQQAPLHHQQHHHNQYALPPPVMTGAVPTVAAAVAVPVKDVNANATVPPVVAVPAGHLITLPPPPLSSTLAIVPTYGGTAVLLPGASAIPPVAVTAAPLVVAAAPPAAPLIVAQPPAGKELASVTPMVQNDIANNNTTSQTNAVINNNNVAQSYHQQQQLSKVQIMTVDTAAQTQSTPSPSQQSSSSSTSVEPAKTAQPMVREKMKEINLRFIAPEEVHTTEYNHDKIVFFVGTAWEDAICGSHGTTKYYEGQ